MNYFETPVLLDVFQETAKNIIEENCNINYLDLFNYKIRLFYKKIERNIERNIKDKYSQDRQEAVQKLFGIVTKKPNNKLRFALSEALDDELVLFEDEERNSIYKWIDNINRFLNPYNESSSNFPQFPSEEDLKKYLDSYYNLYRFIFKNSSLLYEEFQVNKESSNSETVQTLCEYLTYAPTSDSNNCNIFSPYCAEALLICYKAFSQIQENRYFREISPKISPVVKNMISYTFSNKVFRNFRHFVIRDTKLALMSCENTDNFVEKRNYSLSSYELIKPIRLFGKIRRYISSFTSNNGYKVVIIGAVYVNPYFCKKKSQDDVSALMDYSREFYDLYNWLHNWLQYNPETKKYSIEFNIYINKESMPDFFYSNNNHDKKRDPIIIDKFTLNNSITVNFNYVDYKETVLNLAKGKQCENSIIKDDCLLLILDCPFLYDNLQLVTDYVNANEYFRYLPDEYSTDNLNLSECGPIQKVQKQINMLLLNRFNQTGRFERRLKERLIKRISTIATAQEGTENTDKNKTGKTEIFIFVSSHHSIEASEYSRKYEVRVERYNTKEFGLLHFPDADDPLIPFESDEKKSTQIRFRLWNIVVNTDVGALDTIRTEFGLASDVVMEEYVNNIFISFNWDRSKNPFSNANVVIGNNNSITNEKIYPVVESMLLSYFNTIFNNFCNLEKPLLNIMREAFYNVFYSRIANVQHAVAYQKLKEHLELSKEIKLNFIVCKNENDFNSFFGDWDDSEKNDAVFQVSAKKKIFVDVINNFSYDFPSNAKRDVIVSRMRTKDIDPFIVYNDIIKVCNSYRLTGDRLYFNTLKAKEDLG